MQLTLGSRTLKPIAYSALVVAVPSLIASLVVLLLGVLGWESSGTVASIALFASVMVCGFAMVTVMNSFEELSQNQVLKMVWDECPDRIRIWGKSLAAVGMMAFLAQFVLTALGKLPENVEDGFPPLVLGGFGTTVHASTIATLLGANRLREKIDASKCVLGHAVPLTATFCPECGERILRSPSTRITTPD